MRLPKYEQGTAEAAITKRFGRDEVWFKGSYTYVEYYVRLYATLNSTIGTILVADYVESFTEAHRIAAHTPEEMCQLLAQLPLGQRLYGIRGWLEDNLQGVTDISHVGDDSYAGNHIPSGTTTYDLLGNKVEVDFWADWDNYDEDYKVTFNGKLICEVIA